MEHSRPAAAGGVARLSPRAEILAVGAELLTPFRLDTNSLFLTSELNALGVEVAAKHVLGDDLEPLAAAFRASLERADLVVATGGLGPTADDLTREAAARALGLELRRAPELEAQLRARFTRRGRPMPENNLRQADLLAGAEALTNGHGSAPGIWLPRAGPDRDRALLLLPGPPRELRPLFAAEAAPRLRAWARARLGAAPAPLARVALLVADRFESEVDEIAAPLYRPYAARSVETTILAARPGEIELHLRAPALAASALGELAAQLRAALGDAVLAADEPSLEAAVGARLRRRGWTLAVAESCTGGLLGARLTAPPGASDYFLGGVLAYANDLKRDLLGVGEALLRHDGAVSDACARAMALGVRRALGADWGAAVTGIAGPGGGSDAKPVGTVHLAVAGPDARFASVHRVFSGDRDRVRQASVATALDLLRRALT